MRSHIKKAHEGNATYLAGLIDGAKFADDTYDKVFRRCLKERDLQDYLIKEAKKEIWEDDG